MWGVMTRQAPISAFISLVIAVVLTLLVYRTFKAMKAFSMKEDREYEEVVPILWIVWGLAALFSTVIVAALFYDVVTGLLNPEYWALNKLLP